MWALGFALLGCSPPADGPVVDGRYANIGVACEREADGPPEEYVYVGAPGSGGIQVINPRTCRVTREIALDGEPVHLNASASGRWVYATTRSPDAVVFVDTATNTVQRTLPLPFTPTRTWFDGTRRHLWIGGQDGTRILDMGTLVMHDPEVRARQVAMTVSSPPRALVRTEQSVEVRAAIGGARERAVEARLDAMTYAYAEDAVYGCDGAQLVRLAAPDWVPTEVRTLDASCRLARFEDCSDRGLVVTEGSSWWVDGDGPGHAWPWPVDDAGFADGVAVATRPGAGAVELLGPAGARRTVTTEPWRPGRELRVSLDRRHAYVLTDRGLLIVDAADGVVHGRVGLAGDPRAVIVAGPVGGTCC